MDISKRFYPISYLKSNTADIARQLSEETDSVIITQNGVPAFVCISMDEYYQTRETNALLRLLALGEREVKRDKFTSLDTARAELGQTLFGGED
ncbi:type II toxin-antitoxin system Phd/YefM family antitoxin [Oxalobacteraceae bacterium]|nr:type II toxin-antitoxin system Phd/YefM family antitoxin [Oxalobacteraceae bacterium]